MELHEIMQKKFGALDKEALRIVIMALSPCSDGIEWFDENFDGDFSKATMGYLSWFAAPFLKGANLEGANLEEAYLKGANLEEAYLKGANLEGANHDGYTIWPKGFDPLAHGAKE